MHVYPAPYLAERLKLDERVGWWLDYWLFLNSDETHPIWNARPLGIQALAQAALACREQSDRTLRLHLKHEISLAAQLSVFAPSIPGLANANLRVDGSDWSGPWLHWISEIEKPTSPDIIIHELCDALAGSLDHERYKEAAYLTRRLSAELGGREWSRRRLYQSVKQSFSVDGEWQGRTFERSAFATTLQKLFVSPSRSYFKVAFTVAPVEITSDIVKTVGRGARLVTETRDSGILLTGIRNVTYAAHPEEAMAKTHRVAVKILETLRLRFYVRTHLYGRVTVVDDAAGIETFLSLPQPFWTRGKSRRQVPSLPASGFIESIQALPSSEAARWHATRWHLSEAFSDWAEDPHSAAAKIWQALESLAPGAKKGPDRVKQLGDSYLAIVPEEMAGYLATRLNTQAWYLRTASNDESTKTDWYLWNTKTVALRKWLLRVMDEGFSKNFRSWRSPKAPTVLFSPEVGLLVTVYNRLFHPDSEKWMERRLESDFGLLYGLRNKIVHSGARVFPTTMATYLARLGAEIIFTLMGQWSVEHENTTRPSSIPPG